MKALVPSLALFLALAPFTPVRAETSSGPVVTHVKELAAANHPQLCYLFFSPDVLVDDKIYRFLDIVAEKTPYNFVFLTPRATTGWCTEKNDLNFHDTAKFRPVLEKVVAYAHKRGLKIGVQFFARVDDIALADAERAVSEGEITLDAQGRGTWTGKPKNVRMTALLRESAFLGAYAFDKAGDGFYAKDSVRDIADRCKVEVKGKDTVVVTVDAGPAMAGKTAYLMAQHAYSYCNSHQPAASEHYIQALEGYRGVPIDGTGLDEDGNMLVTGGPVRFYGKVMGEKYQATTGIPLLRGLFDMRRAPEGDPAVRVKAVNVYMDLVREGAVIMDRAFTKASKEIFGPQTFAGLHNTFHNNLDGDEIWRTGFKWWSIPREYGQTDEHTALEVQLGGALARPKNAAYNQYYDKNLEACAKKTLGDLRFGVRTHFHAMNDMYGWGVTLEAPKVYAKMEPIERCARLLNRFDPDLPEIKTLVVFGSEAIANPYPDAKPNAFAVRPLGAIQKSGAVRSAGVMTALVPSDLIEEGILKLDAEGKPVMQGRRFDSLVFLNPQHAHESVWKFLESFVAAGGKLMLEGNATHDFMGGDVRERFAALKAKATVTGFNPGKLADIGAVKNTVPDGCRNGDGSYVFTDYASLDPAKPARTQSVVIAGATYAFDYRGLAVILADADGLKKFSARDFTAITRDGETLLRLDTPATVEVVREKDGRLSVTIEGETAKLLAAPATTR
jgi:hypothetical protein